MEQRTFHPFSRLPKELRDAIWGFAVRPQRPSAHFFTIFDSGIEAEWERLSRHAIRDPCFRRCSLAAPQVRDSTDRETHFSWVAGNRSAYTVDSGLWTACGESRDMVERRLRATHWQENDYGPCSLNPSIDLPKSPGAFSFASNGERHSGLTNPESDLYILQVFNAKSLDWFGLPGNVPIFCSRTGGASHVALEFDPDWLDTDYAWKGLDCWATEKPVGCAIRAATDRLDWAENLWFVDYRIRRRPDAPTSTTSRHEFWGDGCKFTEVRESDTEWEFSRDKDIWEFCHFLFLETEEYSHDRYGSEDGSWACAPIVGILAYEECDS